MISGLEIMIFGFFLIFIESRNLGIMLDKDIRGIGFGGGGKGGNIQGVARDICGYAGKMKKDLLKIYHQTLEKKKPVKHVENMLRITQ